MQITTLIENTTIDDRLTPEFGLSLHIAANGVQLLLDTGGSARFIENARVLGIDLAQVDALCISHGHFDHGGGLAHFIHINQAASIYLHEKAVGEFYANIAAVMPRPIVPLIHPLTKQSLRYASYIGLDQGVLQAHSDRFRYIGRMRNIEGNGYLLTDLPHRHDLPKGNKFLMQKTGSSLHPDTFAHEMVLVVQESDGLVVFSGCCHNGILNILEAVQQRFPQTPIKGVVGGFHLAYQPKKGGIAGQRKEIEHIAEEMLKFGVDQVYTGHCTGAEAWQILQCTLGERLQLLATGVQFSL